MILSAYTISFSEHYCHLVPATDMMEPVATMKEEVDYLTEEDSSDGEAPGEECATEGRCT